MPAWCRPTIRRRSLSRDSSHRNNARPAAASSSPALATFTNHAGGERQQRDRTEAHRARLRHVALNRQVIDGPSVRTATGAKLDRVDQAAAVGIDAHVAVT